MSPAGAKGALVDRALPVSGEAWDRPSWGVWPGVNRPRGGARSSFPPDRRRPTAPLAPPTAAPPPAGAFGGTSLIFATRPAVLFASPPPPLPQAESPSGDGAAAWSRDAAAAKRTVIVTGLSSRTTDCCLHEALSQHGVVRGARVFSDFATGRSAGCAAVEFCSAAAAGRAAAAGAPAHRLLPRGVSVRLATPAEVAALAGSSAEAPHWSRPAFFVDPEIVKILNRGAEGGAEGVTCPEHTFAGGSDGSRAPGPDSVFPATASGVVRSHSPAGAYAQPATPVHAAPSPPPPVFPFAAAAAAARIVLHKRCPAAAPLPSRVVADVERWQAQVADEDRENGLKRLQDHVGRWSRRQTTEEATATAAATFGAATLPQVDLTTIYRIQTEKRLRCAKAEL